MLAAAMAFGMLGFSVLAASETDCAGGDACGHVAFITSGTETIHYDTLQEAVTAAAETGGTVSLIKDTTEKITVSSGELVLDLNGKTLTCNDASDSDFIGAINVAGGDLRIVDNSSEKSGAVKGAMFAVLVRDGNLTIEDGTYGSTEDTSAWYEPLFIGKGYATVKGGTFLGEVEYFAYYGDGVGALTLEGGIFAEYPIGVTPQKGFSILAPTDDGFFAAYLTYADFANANSGAFSYDAAENKLKMISDYTVTNVWFNQDLTLDLNGHKFQYSGGYISKHPVLIVNNAVLNIEDSATGGMITTSAQTVIDTMGTVNLHGGVLETKAYGAAVVVSEGGAFCMDGGEVRSAYVGVQNTQKSVTKDETCSIEITGGKVTANTCVYIPSAAISYQYTYYPITTTCVIGGTAALESTGSNGTAINMECTDQPASKVTVNGGSIKGNLEKTTSAVGTIVVNSGTFSSDVSAYVPEGVEITPNEDGSFTVGGTVTPAVISANDVDAVIAADGQTATMRFITKVDAAPEQPKAFYTWILPQFVFEKIQEDIPYAIVNYAVDAVAADKTFGADLENIPYEYFNEPIMAWSYMENGAEKASCTFEAKSVDGIVGSKQN